jgi:hypothetical protein
MSHGNKHYNTRLGTPGIQAKDSLKLAPSFLISAKSFVIVFSTSATFCVKVVSLSLPSYMSF